MATNESETQQQTAMSAEAPVVKPRPTESNEQYEVLEKEMRFSECIVWRYLEEYYSTESISAFEVIPSYMTSNPYIAEAYAEQIIAFLQDVRSHLDYSSPFYIVEMAAGSGTFSFYLVKELLRKLAYFSDLKQLQLRYVITDFAEGNVSAWEQSKGFRRYMDQGVLDFAIFRPEDQQELVLRYSKDVINPKTLKNPVVAIANYFFDSIRMDLFRVDKGNFQEIRKTIFKERQPKQQYKWPMAQLKSYETYHDASPDGYYQNDKLNTILKQYQQEMENATIMFPVSTFKVIDNLLAMTKNNLCLIASDKGFCYRDFMREHWEVEYSLHGEGALSLMVNFEAVRRYIQLHGGRNWNTTPSNYYLCTSVNVVSPWQDVAFEQTDYVFEEKIEKQNLPHNLFFARDFAYESNHKDPQVMLTSAMGLLEISNYDIEMYWSVLDKILSGVYNMSWRQHSKLVRIMDRALDNFYAVRKRFDVFVWSGRVFYEMNEFKRCMTCMERSIEEFGPSGPAYYHLGACYEVFGDYAKALDNYQNAKAFAPDCELTQGGIDRMTRLVESAQ